MVTLLGDHAALLAELAAASHPPIHHLTSDRAPGGAFRLFGAKAHRRKALSFFVGVPLDLAVAGGE
jgi:hypothetical protein